MTYCKSKAALQDTLRDIEQQASATQKEGSGLLRCEQHHQGRTELKQAVSSTLPRHFGEEWRGVGEVGVSVLRVCLAALGLSEHCGLCQLTSNQVLLRLNRLFGPCFHMLLWILSVLERREINQIEVKLFINGSTRRAPRPFAQAVRAEPRGSEREAAVSVVSNTWTGFQSSKS